MRPTLDACWMAVARAVATRGACARARVGCVLVDAAGRAVSTGYNGRSPGLANCGGGWRCPGASDEGGCEATHAEANAVAAADRPSRTACAYVTVMPCLRCAKLLLATGCRRVVYREPHPEAAAVAVLLAEAGAELVQESGDGALAEA